MKNLFLYLGLFLMSLPVFAQQNTITAGPIVGGVSDNSARVYIQTGSPQMFELQVAADSLFTSLLQTYNDSTRAGLFGGITVNMVNLQANMTYYYRFLFNGNADIRKGRFTTFPTEGVTTNLKIVLGSCNYAVNDQLFQRIQNFNPQILLHVGDWNWPPAQFGNEMCLYPNLRAASFASRYNDSSMQRRVLPYFPVDYIYDDDFSWNDGEATTYATYSVTIDFGGAHTALNTVDMPNVGIREGAIRGYFDHFPSYPAVDTAQGIYHSFKMGNVEIFMLDCRNNRTARHRAFVQDSLTELYTYSPPANHTMLGAAQREWLINGLRNSTADWKLIGSSVIFNKNYQILFDAGMQLQNLFIPYNGQTYTGAVLASQMSYNWVGFPNDQDTILAMAQNGELRDAIMMSGDSHSNMIDDGTNAGLPEISASGMAANNEGSVNYYFNLFGSVLGYGSVEDILWNGGGNGMGTNSQNYNDGYGTIEVFGKDSIRLCVNDENGVSFGCKTIKHSSLVGTEASVLPETDMLKLYPVPANNTLAVHSAQKIARLRCLDMTGRVVYEEIVNDKKATISLQTFAEGLYLVQICDAENRVLAAKKFVKR